MLLHFLRTLHFPRKSWLQGHVTSLFPSSSPALSSSEYCRASADKATFRNKSRCAAALDNSVSSTRIWMIGAPHIQRTTNKRVKVGRRVTVRDLSKADRRWHGTCSAGSNTFVGEMRCACSLKMRRGGGGDGCAQNYTMEEKQGPIHS